ncbi:HAD-IIA family hydrolase [Stenoxybacter acetivorans]|uniref:HAD-IIA family hydrolase n=1 Tax=Stenoxybacter acetivorans TaxID=422441 RepID=UPI0006924D85|nr:HAD-IIA family hydrolase [Stenoxybacter acetivorans]
MENSSYYKGVILDIDGTLLLHGKALPGAGEATAALRRAGYQLRFVSNTTSRSEAQLAQVLLLQGIDASEAEIQTSVSACLCFLQSHFSDKKGFIAVPEALQTRFSQLEQCGEQPDYVVLGDLDEGFNYAILNRIFNFIRNGAQLIVFHKNNWYFRDGKTWLDSGAFTRALELAGNTQAVVVGKPSPVMFQSAIQCMGLPKDQVLVVGDDVTTDVDGARNAGLPFLLVGSGKFKPADLTTHNIPQNHFISTIIGLPEWLQYRVTY